MLRRHIRKFLTRAIIGICVLWFLLSMTSTNNPTENKENKYDVVIDKSLQREVKPAPEVNKPNGHTLPYSVSKALDINVRNGFLLGNSSYLAYQPYPDEVDLRIIVMVYDRATSLRKCLNSLQDVDYLGDSVSIHIWIDRQAVSNTIPMASYLVAKKFHFKKGQYYVHIHPRHMGIQGQWLYTYRPRTGSKEIVLFLEDDMTVSPFFYRWLKPAQNLYYNRTDISGYSLSYPRMAHGNGNPLIIPKIYNVYLYRVICTWAFSPHPRSWRKFQEWFFTSEQNPNFEPLVLDILPSQWFGQHKAEGKERNLWEMWHIYYTHNSIPPQYTLLLNSVHEGLLAINRNERGLHDPGEDAGIPKEPLCGRWKRWYIKFPKDPPKIGYDGLEEDKTYEDEEEEKFDH